ncbi:MAG: patatin-like phospholipase family protein [Candidatus Cloacimonetes bacterium]|nr:patatin-like phospholipase family protein [Candidatus Cloacimonadota bacterium]
MKRILPMMRCQTGSFKSLFIAKRYLLLATFCLIALLCPAHELGIALSGGGARGFAHIGVLKVLEEEGIRPKYISGTSVGALIGAFYAMGYSAAEIESLAIATDWESFIKGNETREDLYIGHKRWAPYGNVSFELGENWKPQLPYGLYMVNGINIKLFELYAAASPYQDFSELPISFACMGTNLITGEPKSFTQGSLMQALRASMSIPSIFLPFEIDDELYIDGGISQNLPVKLLKDLGADTVIGIKVSSSLRDKDSLGNLIKVFDQSLNIGIIRNLNQELEACDILFEPELSGYVSTDFKHIKELIVLGEEYARAQLPLLKEQLSFYQQEELTPLPSLRQNRFWVQEIEVKGNTLLSQAKIREYTRLEAQREYDPLQIARGCLHGWNTEFFQVIYPTLEPLGSDSYRLLIHVKERANKLLSLNMSYNSDVKLSASAILRLNNVLLKNSTLLTELRLGGENELNIDYVKNFGELWGIYYRIFPYVNEKTMYVYNEDHFRTSSIKSFEGGFTSGLGVFSPSQGVAEFFAYSNYTHLYRGMAETPIPPRTYTVSGFGLKLMHECLDDYVFPTRGLSFISKFNFARNKEISDFVYSKFGGELQYHLPLAKTVSVNTMIDVGSYFNSAPLEKFDPYPLGGTEGFVGLPKYQISAPHYRILQAGIKLHPRNMLYIDAGMQHLSYAENELWGTEYNTMYCVYGGLGLKLPFFPVRLKLAVNNERQFTSMLNVGYDSDIFHFSRN